MLYKQINQSDKKTFIISSEVIDRDGSIVLLDGLDTSNFVKYGTILYNHRMDKPIGSASNLRITEINGIKSLVADVVITDPEIAEMVENGTLKATSIGFIAKQIERGSLSEADKLKYPHLKQVELITKSELYEFSIVTVPANPNAIRIKSKINQIRQIMETKAGATLSKSNLAKLEEAMNLIQDVIETTIKPEPEVKLESLKSVEDEILKLIEV